VSKATEIRIFSGLLVDWNLFILFIKEQLTNMARVASRAGFGDGHSSALANPISFSRIARGMSMMVITRWM
jgi:hypothetical protein